MGDGIHLQDHAGTVGRFSRGFDADAMFGVPRDQHHRTASTLNADLSRLIEGEVLPRLMQAHRAAPVRPQPATPHRFTQADVSLLCSLLLDAPHEAMEGYVESVLDRGAGLASVLTELLAPSARSLGEMWEEDEADFVAVTVAVGRLQAIAHEFCARLERRDAFAARARIRLLPSPGETHTFAISVMAGLFRERGWRVSTAAKDDDRDGADVAREWFDVIGLSLSCDTLVAPLANAVAKLRSTSLNPGVRIIVGGPFFERHPMHPVRECVDAVVQDGRSAVEIAESLLDKQAVAC